MICPLTLIGSGDPEECYEDRCAWYGGQGKYAKCAIAEMSRVTYPLMLLTKGKGGGGGGGGGRRQNAPTRTENPDDPF